MGKTTVTRNYQVTLPADVREIEDIKIGDTLIVIPRNGEIMMRKIKKADSENYFGAWKTRGSGVAFTRKIRDESETRLKRLKL